MKIVKFFKTIFESPSSDESKSPPTTPKARTKSLNHIIKPVSHFKIDITKYSKSKSIDNTFQLDDEITSKSSTSTLTLKSSDESCSIHLPEDYILIDTLTSDRKRTTTKDSDMTTQTAETQTHLRRTDTTTTFTSEYTSATSYYTTTRTASTTSTTSTESTSNTIQLTSEQSTIAENFTQPKLNLGRRNSKPDHESANFSDSSMPSFAVPIGIAEDLKISEPARSSPGVIASYLDRVVDDSATADRKNTDLPSEKRKKVIRRVSSRQKRRIINASEKNNYRRTEQNGAKAESGKIDRIRKYIPKSESTLKTKEVEKSIQSFSVFH